MARTRALLSLLSLRPAFPHGQWPEVICSGQASLPGRNRTIEEVVDWDNCGFTYLPNLKSSLGSRILGGLAGSEKSSPLPSLSEDALHWAALSGAAGLPLGACACLLPQFLDIITGSTGVPWDYH